ncbi:MAG: IDEAL domain-containing protein [Bacillus sp. (in: firmicutes)]
MNEKSYTELTKLNAMNKSKEKETYVMDLYIDMLLSEIQLNTEKASLMILIDQAIDEHNKELFLELSLKFNKLCKRFGN